MKNFKTGEELTFKVLGCTLKGKFVRLKNNIITVMVTEDKTKKNETIGKLVGVPENFLVRTKDIRILKDEVLSKTPFVKFVNRMYFDKDGKLRNWSFAQRNNDRQAVMIVATVNGMLVVTKEYRVPIANYEIGFPAGLIDEGESIEEAAIRELKEETGLTVTKIKSVTPFLFNSPGITDESIAIVYAEAEGTPSTEFQEAAEDIETFLLTPAEVNEKLCSNHCFGAKAYIEMKNYVERNSI